MKFLNSREIKKIREKVIEEFGTWLKRDYAYVQNNKGRVFVVNKTVAEIDLDKMRVDRMGLYFAEVGDNQVRLSKEGAQLLVLEGDVKDLVDLDDAEASIYFKGEDVEKDLGSESKLIILRYKNGIVGCARYKEGKILNFLPKIHRSGSIIL